MIISIGIWESRRAFTRDADCDKILIEVHPRESFYHFNSSDLSSPAISS